MSSVDIMYTLLVFQKSRGKTIWSHSWVEKGVDVVWKGRQTN